MSSADIWKSLPGYPKPWKQPKLSEFGTLDGGKGLIPSDTGPLHQLTAAVQALPGPLPCTEGHPLSDDAAERRTVAETMCPDCPVQPLCRAAGENETFGVWGGIDQTQRARGGSSNDVADPHLTRANTAGIGYPIRRAEPAESRNEQEARS